jgi:hypothetical protein
MASFSSFSLPQCGVAAIYPSGFRWRDKGDHHGRSQSDNCVRMVQSQQLVELKAENQNLRVAQAQQMQMVLQQQAAQAQQLAELKLQNDSLRAAVERFQGSAAVATTAASRLQ